MAKPKLFTKFQRPTEKDRGRITDRDLDIIEAILRYRFSPTSELLRLVGSNQKVTHRHLRRLWEWGYISRFAFPAPRSHSEFHYYLENRLALELLAELRGVQPHPTMLEEIDNNREKDYAGAAVRGQHMQLGFLKHSLMISRFHFMLEMATRASAGQVELVSWAQGGPLAGRKVEVPKIKSERVAGHNEYLWREADDLERLPVEPDGMFTLRFPARPPERQLAHFFYEADRGTMNYTDMREKLRAYYHYIKKQQRHKEEFGIHPIRAVLVETTDEGRGKKLMELVNHPLVCGPRRAGLFWFSISPLFTDPPDGQRVAHYLEKPEIVLKQIWALPDRTLHSLSDAENS